VRGIKHADGEIIDTKSGLVVRADRTGAITFSFRYRTGVARRRVVVGRYPGVSLAEGRAAVSRMREQVRNGADPQQERQARRSALTFDALADRYIEEYAQKRKSSWKNDAGYLATHARPAWGKRSAASITKQDAEKLLLDVVAVAPVSANRLRSVLAKLFTWSVDSKLLTETPMLGTKKPHKEGQGKDRVLRDDELRVLWRALDDAAVTPGTRAALRVLMLLGQRPGEVVGMATAELVDLEDPRNARWELPAERMKTRRAHVVPLPPLAVEIIGSEIARQPTPQFVFASKFAERQRMARHSLSQALRRVIENLDADCEVTTRLKTTPLTPHDLRRTVASGLSRLGVPRDDRLAVLAHSYDDTHEVYDRYDRLTEKRAALTLWEAHVRKVLTS
jgi:integrase